MKKVNCSDCKAMKNGYLNKNSMGRQLLFRIVLMSTLITGLFTVINFFHDYQNQISKIEKTLVYIEKSTLSSIGLALWNYDRDQVKNIVNGLSGVDFITDISIFSTNDEIFYSTKKKIQDKRFLKTKNYKLKTILKGQQKDVGHLVITITKKHIYSQLVEDSVIFFVTQGIKTLIVSFFILLIFYQLVGKPILHITTHLQETQISAMKNLDAKMWNRFPTSELAILGTTINNLIDKIMRHEKINVDEIDRQRNFLEDTINHLPIGFYARRNNSRKIILNRQLQRYLSIKNTSGTADTAAKTLATNIYSNLDLTPNPKVGMDIEQKLNQLDELCKNKALPNGISHEIELDHNNGEKRIYDLIQFPYLNANGDHYATGHLLIDNTDKKELERQSNHQAKLVSLGELAAGVGHEINNPLTIIMGQIGKLRDLATEEGDSGKFRLNLLNSMCLASKRIANITMGLRNFSRLDTAVNEKFDMVKLIQESFLMLVDIYESEGVALKLTSTLENKHITINGNRGRIQQVIINLISNAKDACRDESKPTINIALRQDQASSIYFDVIDNGSGIAPSLAEKIFDPFFTTKDFNHGTGIGLSLAHNIVKEHNGEIYFQANVDRGTTFTLRIPVLLKNSKGSTVPADLAQESTKQPKINLRALVLDDETDVADVLCDILQDVGVTAKCFCSGELAYSEYIHNASQYDLIISDMKMPEMDGPSFLKKIRSSRGIKQPYFIFMTGGATVSLDDEALENSIDGYFFKPFVISEVTKILAKIAATQDISNAA